MNTEFFPHFIRANYPSLGSESNETLIEAGEDFKKYLEEKFEGNLEKLEPIWDINPKTIIMNQVNNTPFLVNGYHPAFIIHFENFVKEIQEGKI